MNLESCRRRSFATFDVGLEHQFADVSVSTIGDDGPPRRNSFDARPQEAKMLKDDQMQTLGLVANGAVFHRKFLESIPQLFNRKGAP